MLSRPVQLNERPTCRSGGTAPGSLRAPSAGLHGRGARDSGDQPRWHVMQRQVWGTAPASATFSGRAGAGCLLMVCVAWRVSWTHWSPRPPLGGYRTGLQGHSIPDGFRVLPARSWAPVMSTQEGDSPLAEHKKPPQTNRVGFMCGGLGRLGASSCPLPRCVPVDARTARPCITTHSGKPHVWYPGIAGAMNP